MLERTFTKRCFAISSFARLNFLSLTPLEGRLRPRHDYDLMILKIEQEDQDPEPVVL